MHLINHRDEQHRDEQYRDEPHGDEQDRDEPHGDEPHGNEQDRDEQDFSSECEEERGFLLLENEVARVTSTSTDHRALLLRRLCLH